MPGLLLTLLVTGLVLSVLIAGRLEAEKDRHIQVARFLEQAARQRLNSMSSGFFHWTAMAEAVGRGDRSFLSAEAEELRSAFGVVGILFEKDGEEVFRAGATDRLGPQMQGRIPSAGGVLEVGRAFVIHDDFGKPFPDRIVSAWVDLSPQVRSVGSFADLPEFTSEPGAGDTEIIPGVWIPEVSQREVLREVFGEKSTVLFLVIQAILVFVGTTLAVFLFSEKETRKERLVALTKILEEKDPYTMGHSARVAEYAVRIGWALGYPSARLETIRLAALCHDLGKVFVPIEILNKPVPLNLAEWETMKQHPVDSQRLFVKLLPDRRVGEIIRHHHERWDGKGYPDGLSADNIPFESRIIAVADTYDALTSERPYRDALSSVEALAIIAENAGTQLDPQVVKIALNTLGSGLGSWDCVQTESSAVPV